MKIATAIAINALALFVGTAALTAAPAVWTTRINVLPLAVANSPAGMNRIAAPVTITNTETLTGSLQVATAIAKYFGVNTTVVTSLHNSGHGYGEIVKAFVLAKSSGKSVDDIFAMRGEEQGWGQLLHTLAISKWDTSFGKIQHAANPKHGIAPGTAPGNSGEKRQNEGKGSGNGGGEDQDSDKTGADKSSPGNSKPK